MTSISRRLSQLATQFRDYLGIGSRVRPGPIATPAALEEFLSTRASFIAQTSLYGYLRTRAGQRYPELFEGDEFVVSINIAKWHMWLACLSDLAVYAGGLVARGSGVSDDAVRALMLERVDGILDRTGVPAEADAEFPAHAQRVRQRIASTRWHEVEDGDACFSASPDALVRWAPIVKTLMELDEPIVRNSVSFHWQEVRRELREHLDARAVARPDAD